jgi:translation elongation factor EF-Tu-like GTPase
MKTVIIGNINHGKTPLSEVILKFKELGNDIIVVDDEKSRGLTIEQDKANMFKALREYGGIEEVVKSGRENRRERRKRERKNK